MSRRPLPPPRVTGAADVLRSRYRTDAPGDDDEAADAVVTSEGRDAVTSRPHEVVASAREAPTVVDETGPEPTRRPDPVPSRRREFASPQSRDGSASRARDVTKPQRADRPSATADTTVAFTIRFSADQADAHLQLLMDLKRTGRLKRLPDKSEVIRIALQLLDEDPELQQRILDRL